MHKKEGHGSNRTTNLQSSHPLHYCHVVLQQDQLLAEILMVLENVEQKSMREIWGHRWECSVLGLLFGMWGHQLTAVPHSPTHCDPTDSSIPMIGERTSE